MEDKQITKDDIKDSFISGAYFVINMLNDSAGSGSYARMLGMKLFFIEEYLNEIKKIK